jgi:hypothetical protein
VTVNLWICGEENLKAAIQDKAVHIVTAYTPTDVIG